VASRRPDHALDKSACHDYFDHLFGGPGEMLRGISVRLSGQAWVALLSRLEQLVLELSSSTTRMRGCRRTSVIL